MTDIWLFNPTGRLLDLKGLNSFLSRGRGANINILQPIKPAETFKFVGCHRFLNFLIVKGTFFNLGSYREFGASTLLRTLSR